jgi:hypothetical protein
MDVIKVNDLFSPEDIEKITKKIKYPIENNEDFFISENLGRYQFGIRGLDRDTEIKLLEIANSVSDFECGFSGAAFVEYNLEYGNPNLPTHLDGDFNDLIINYQLSSNTSWDIGVDFNAYKMEDNSAVLFNPNKNVHWRPRKLFKDGEFVKMIFFRFHKLNNISDYSHLRQYWSHHKIFEDINKFRDSVSDSSCEDDMPSYTYGEIT